MRHHSSLCFCFVLRKALSVILEAINPLSSCLSFTSARIMCTTMASFWFPSQHKTGKLGMALWNHYNFNREELVLIFQVWAGLLYERVCALMSVCACMSVVSDVHACLWCQTCKAGGWGVSQGFILSPFILRQSLSWNQSSQLCPDIPTLPVPPRVTGGLPRHGVHMGTRDPNPVLKFIWRMLCLLSHLQPWDIF